MNACSFIREAAPRLSLECPTIAFHLGCSIFDLGLERLGTYHRLLQIGAIDGEGQVGLVDQKPWMFVSVESSSSTRNFSPLSDVIR